MVYVYFQIESLAVTLIKCGILLFYWRVFPSQNFRIAVYIVAALAISSYLSIAFGFAFQCTPVRAFWNHAVRHTCINQHVFDLIVSVELLISDIVIYILPMHTVWGLKMTRKKKIELTFVFLIGGV
jgi:hypothetical protein